MTRGNDLLQDVLRQLDGWNAEPTHISRTLTIDDRQHADLTERIKIFADALELNPYVKRHDGRTQIEVNRTDGVTMSEIKFAARVEDAYQHIAGVTANPHKEPTTGSLKAWWQRKVGR